MFLLLVFAGSTLAGTTGKSSLNSFSTQGNGDTITKCTQSMYGGADETKKAEEHRANQDESSETGSMDGIITCNSNIFHVPPGFKDQIFPVYQDEIHAILNPLMKSQLFTFREPDPPRLA